MYEKVLIQRLLAVIRKQQKELGTELVTPAMVVGAALTVIRTDLPAGTPLKVVKDQENLRGLLQERIIAPLSERSDSIPVRYFRDAVTGIYLLAAAAMFFGDDIRRIYSSCVYTKEGLDRQDSVTIEYRDGRMAVLSFTITGAGENRCVITGTTGYMVIDNITGLGSLKVYDAARKELASYKRPRQKTGYEYVIRSCVEAVKQGKMECEEAPRSQTISILHMTDHIRRQLGIVYPKEKPAEQVEEIPAAESGMAAPEGGIPAQEPEVPAPEGEMPAPEPEEAVFEPVAEEQVSAAAEQVPVEELPSESAPRPQKSYFYEAGSLPVSEEEKKI